MTKGHSLRIGASDGRDIIMRDAKSARVGAGFGIDDASNWPMPTSQTRVPITSIGTGAHWNGFGFPEAILGLT